jgi:hypothetical protein
MLNNNFLRIAGVAGIITALCMVGMILTSDPQTFAPTSPLFSVFLWGGNLAGIVLTIGLYQFYCQEAATWSLVAAGLSLLGYLLFVIASFGPFNPENILVRVADILVYVVGVPLFSWLAYTTRKVSRPLSTVGFLAGLAGVGVYALALGAGVDPANPNHPLMGVMYAFYSAYLILVLVWLVWTGFALVLRKPQLAMA